MDITGAATNYLLILWLPALTNTIFLLLSRDEREWDKLLSSYFWFVCVSIALDFLLEAFFPGDFGYLKLILIY